MSIINKSDRYMAELKWRREIMAEAKDNLASGRAQAAYDVLTRHEQEGYPWARGVPGNMGPDAAHRPSVEQIRRVVASDARRRIL